MFSEEVMQIVLKKTTVKLIIFCCLSGLLVIFFPLPEAGFSSSNVTIMDEL